MWKNIPDWEQLYEVNELGDVRSKRTGKLIKGDDNSAGYNRVTFYDGKRKKRVFRHRLVADLFVENPNKFPEVNHIDEDKKNNIANNLEWVTRIENEHKNHRSNSKPYRPFFVEFESGEVKHYEFYPQLANEINVTTTTVRNWLKNKYYSYCKSGIKKINYESKA